MSSVSRENEMMAKRKEIIASIEAKNGGTTSNKVKDVDNLDLEDILRLQWEAQIACKTSL